MGQPTKEQAREYLVSDLIDEIQREEEKQSNRKLALILLKSGSVDEDIEIKIHEDKWMLDIRFKDLDVSVCEFVDKIKVVEQEVERF